MSPSSGSWSPQATSPNTPPSLATGPTADVLRRLELTVTRRLDGMLQGDYRGLVPGHGSELGDGGPHKTDRIPYVFTGGKALGFKLGQSINFTGMVPAASGSASRPSRPRRSSTAANATEITVDRKSVV